MSSWQEHKNQLLKFSFSPYLQFDCTVRVRALSVAVSNTGFHKKSESFFTSQSTISFLSLTMLHKIK
jgi:hypothetical protein